MAEQSMTDEQAARALREAGVSHEAPTFRRWDTPSGLPPVKIQYGDAAFLTAVKVGDEWLPVSVLDIEFATESTFPMVTLKLPAGRLTMELIGSPRT